MSIGSITASPLILTNATQVVASSAPVAATATSSATPLHGVTSTQPVYADTRRQVGTTKGTPASATSAAPANTTATGAGGKRTGANLDLLA